MHLPSTSSYMKLFGNHNITTLVGRKCCALIRRGWTRLKANITLSCLFLTSVLTLYVQLIVPFFFSGERYDTYLYDNILPSWVWHDPARVRAYVQYDIHNITDTGKIPTCLPASQVSAKYAFALPQLAGQSIFIASILHNSQEILYGYSEALLQTLAILAPHNVSIYVSIYENGSKDQTKSMLHRLEQALDELNVPRTIITDATIIDWSKVERIETLANLRNKALNPLWSSSRHFENILFLNDIVTCPEDMIELMVQHIIIQKSHFTCGQDILNYQNRDPWVERDMNGKQISLRLRRNPHAKHLNLYFSGAWVPHRDREDLVLPHQLFTCWGGMAMFISEPLLQHGLRFRHQNTSTPECYSSECYYLPKEFWILGYNRIVNVKTAICAYFVIHYNEARDLIDQRIAYLGNRRPDYMTPSVDGIKMRIELWNPNPPATVGCWDQSLNVTCRSGKIDIWSEGFSQPST